MSGVYHRLLKLATSSVWLCTKKRWARGDQCFFLRWDRVIKTFERLARRQGYLVFFYFDNILVL